MIDVNETNNQASKFTDYKNDLNNMKSSIDTMKTSLSNDWVSNESAHINSILDTNGNDITSIMDTCTSLDNDIKTTANELRAEDERSAEEAAHKASLKGE